MNIKLSEQKLSISPSVTLSIDAKTKQMRADGIDVISFGVGEPDFKTPENIRNKAIDLIQKGTIGYTAASGLPELKRTICDKLKRDNNLSYHPDDIIVSNGAKHSLFNAFQAICNPGDEVIIPIPYWVSYPEIVKMASAIPIFVECSEKNEFKLKKEDLLSAITSKTKAIMLNSPSNPTGAVYSKSELEEIAEIAIKNNIIVVSDEIYEKLVYDGETHTSIASLNEAIKEKTIVINGMSKGYAMTGWRIGYTASSRSIAKIMGNFQSHTTSNPNTIAQYASIEGLGGDQSSVEKMRKAFDARRKYMVNRINQIEGLSCIVPKGAFYVMMNISGLIGKEIYGKVITNSIDLADIILENANVAIVPGIAFGSDEFVRLSYATSLENIELGLNRIANCLNYQINFC